MNLRDKLGADLLPPLRTSGQDAATIHWLLNAQIAVANAAGVEMSLRSCGMPKDLENDASNGSMSAVFGSRPGTPRAEPPPGMPPVPQSSMPPPPVVHAPYGYDEGYAPVAPTPGPPLPQAVTGRSDAGFGGHLTAHDEVNALARAARQRNQGTLSLGGDPSWDAPTSALARSRVGVPLAQVQLPRNHPNARGEVSRPGTAASAASRRASDDSASEAHTNRMRGMSNSFTLG
jgi:hypothetical protein